MVEIGPSDLVLDQGSPQDDITVQSSIERFAGMGQVVIRNIDDGVIETLKARAAAERKSLEQSLRDLLTATARPNRAELIATLKRIQAMTPPRAPGVNYPTADELIRQGRDER